MKILVINGPNLNLLGLREPDIYGKRTYRDLVEMIRAEAERLGVSVEFVQSNHEGALVDAIQDAFGVFDGIVINPGAYTHTSVALLDAVKDNYSLWRDEAAAFSQGQAQAGGGASGGK